MRGRVQRRRILTRKRAVWCNIPFGGVNFTESIGVQLLLTPEDWEAQFSGNANEKATLRAIVGNITIQQTAVGTAGTTGFWGIYASSKGATVTPSFTVAGMGDVDWLLTGSLGISTSVTTSLTSAQGAVLPINIRAKRKLDSNKAIFIAAQYGSDAASPAGVIGGLLRFLVARD